MKDTPTSELLLRYARETLNQRMTWMIMLVVGTVINLYGQLLIPWLRNAGSPVDIFLDECVANPGVLALSVALGFVFPLLVSVFSGTWAHFQGRRLHGRSLFPDAKPDPVFRVNEAGQITDAGERTWSFLGTHGVTTAAAILGELGWAWLQQASQQEETAHRCRTVCFAGNVYAVTWAKVDGAVNVYMTLLGKEGNAELEAVA